MSWIQTHGPAVYFSNEPVQFILGFSPFQRLCSAVKPSNRRITPKMSALNTWFWSVGLLKDFFKHHFSPLLLFYSVLLFFLCLKKLFPTSALLCLWLSEKTECLNSATRPLICDWVWEMRQPSVGTSRELSASFSLPQRPTAGFRPQKHTRQWPPGAETVDSDAEKNSTDATVCEYTEVVNPCFFFLLWAWSTHSLAQYVK